MAENTPAIHLQFTEYYFPHSAGGPGTSDISLHFLSFFLFCFVCDNTNTVQDLGIESFLHVMCL